MCSSSSERNLTLSLFSVFRLIPAAGFLAIFSLSMPTRKNERESCLPAIAAGRFPSAFLGLIRKYDRKPPYHPSQDSIVRTEARRLRTKLNEYYESEGKNNPIFIYFRPGSYIPVFRSKVSASGQEIEAASSAEDVFIEGAGITVAVIPFLDASGQPLSAKYAQGITDELVHKLMQCEGCRIVAASSIAQLMRKLPSTGQPFM